MLFTVHDIYFCQVAYQQQLFKVLIVSMLISCSFGIITFATQLDFFVFFATFLCQILDNNCAYVVGGDVYFSVDNFPEYGELSGRKLDDNRAGERVAVDERKRNPADFALWKVKDVPDADLQHFLYSILC